MAKPTEEEIENEMKKDMKDKLIPYHNMPYPEQIVQKEIFLKDVFYKFSNRVVNDVESGFELRAPGWLKSYWASLTPTDVKNDPNSIEELKLAESDPVKEEIANTEKGALKRLPCDFEGVIECDPEFMQGYRNKVEFTIGRHYTDKQICVGFMKGSSNQGILFVDYPYETIEGEIEDGAMPNLVPLPHISQQSVRFAWTLQKMLREFEGKYGLKEYSSMTHEGAWR